MAGFLSDPGEEEERQRRINEMRATIAQNIAANRAGDAAANPSPPPPERGFWGGLLQHGSDLAHGYVDAGKAAVARANDPTLPVPTMAPGEAAETIASLVPTYPIGKALGQSFQAARSGDTFDIGKNAGLLATSLAMAVAPGGGGKGPPRTPITRSTQLPNLRGMPAADAIKIARAEPHLIEGGEGTEGLYVGAPRNVQSRADLLRNRRAVDRGIDAGALGGDWYDRYRGSINETTGGDPTQNRWATALHGQMSAGVDPGSELAGAVKEVNAVIAGVRTPEGLLGTKAMRPAQHEAHLAAIEQQDPTQYQLGKKTGEYAKRIEPIQEGGLLGPRSPMIGHNQGPPLEELPPYTPGSTGVNDFRWAAEHGFTEPDGSPQKNALTDAQHNYLDYETTLAVDRANKRAAGGRTNWTGEQVQAAGWVRQKADSILEARPALLQDRLDRVAKQATSMGWDKDQVKAAQAQARKEADAEAFALANREIGDFYGKHTAFATHESRPGSDTGHLPGLLNTPEEVAAYHADPASTWATAPGKRDAFYAGLGIPGTGVNMRVRPTTDMQGVYTPPGGATEFNPGQTARPLVAFNNLSGGLKELPEADRSILHAAETVRAGFDAQNAGSAHKVWLNGPAGKSNSIWVPLDRKLTETEAAKLEAYGKQNGLPHVSDTGTGVTLTDFENGPPQMSRKQMEAHSKAIREIVPTNAGLPARSKVDAVFSPLSDAWKKGPGSGAVTDEMLKAMSATPELWRAFNQNPHLAAPLLAKLKRDAPLPGARSDIQNLRKIGASGKDWADKLLAAKKRGEWLPAIAGVGAGGLLTAGALQQEDDAR